MCGGGADVSSPFSIFLFAVDGLTLNKPCDLLSYAIKETTWGGYFVIM